MLASLWYRFGSRIGAKSLKYLGNIQRLGQLIRILDEKYAQGFGFIRQGNSQNVPVFQLWHRPCNVGENVLNLDVEKARHVSTYGIESEGLKLTIIDMLEFDNFETSHILVSDYD